MPKFIVKKEVLSGIDILIKLKLEIINPDGKVVKPENSRDDFLAPAKQMLERRVGAKPVANRFLLYSDPESLMLAEKYFILVKNSKYHDKDIKNDNVDDLSYALSSKESLLLYMRYRTISVEDEFGLANLFANRAVKILAILFNQNYQRTRKHFDLTRVINLYFHDVLGESLVSYLYLINMKSPYFYSASYGYLIMLLQVLNEGDITNELFRVQLNKVLKTIRDTGWDGIPDSEAGAIKVIIKSAHVAVRRHISILEVGEIKRILSISLGEIKARPNEVTKNYMPSITQVIPSEYPNVKHKVPDETRVVVLTHHVKGCFGDVSIASKLLQSMVKPENRIDLYWLIRTKDDIENLRGFEVEGVTTFYMNNFGRLRSCYKDLLLSADKVLSLPTMHKFSVSMERFLRTKVNLTSISEYNFSSLGVHDHSLGIASRRSSKELGIFISDAPRTDTLPPKIFPQYVYQAFDPSVRNSIKDNVLFFMYTADRVHESYKRGKSVLPAEAYMLAIAININEIDDLVIIGRWGKLDQRALSKFLKNTANRCNVLISFNNTRYQGSKRERTIYLLDPFPLEHSVMKLLQYYANPICIKTGDQSLAESMCFSRLPLYQCLPWKERYIQSVIGLLKRKNLSSLASYYELGLSVLQSVEIEEASRLVNKLCSLVTSKGDLLSAQARSLSRVLAKEQDASAKVLNLCIEREPMELIAFRQKRRAPSVESNVRVKRFAKDTDILDRHEVTSIKSHEQTLKLRSR